MEGLVYDLSAVLVCARVPVTCWILWVWRKGFMHPHQGQPLPSVCMLASAQGLLAAIVWQSACPKSYGTPLTAIFRLAMMRIVPEGRARKTLKRLMCCELAVCTRKNWYAKQAAC
jgi:hypothetical protein